VSLFFPSLNIHVCVQVCLIKKNSGLESSRKDPNKSLSWTDFYAQELYLEEDVEGLHIVHHAYITPPTNSGPLFVAHHGAGSSGLSFAVCAIEIRKALPEAGILSIDARHHGSTTVEPLDGSEKKEPDYRLGGAVITDVAKSGELGDKVLAHAVLDVVEGTVFALQ
jgi:protein phosphatase methylesterase 1